MQRSHRMRFDGVLAVSTKMKKENREFTLVPMICADLLRVKQAQTAWILSRSTTDGTSSIDMTGRYMSQLDVSDFVTAYQKDCPFHFSYIY